MSSQESSRPRSRWAVLTYLAVAELLGMSLWFTASAVSPQLRVLWDLGASQAGWLTTTVQLGFVAGTLVAALLNLADIVPAKRYFATSAVAAALANGALVIAPGYAAALGCRFLTGFFLAGVYPPAMKMIATWFRDARGLAIGTIVGALTIGKATPYLLEAFPSLGYRSVVLAASGNALVAALIVATLYHDGPEPFARRPFSWGLVGRVIRHRETRLAVGGYLGHMWELYAGWAGLSLFFHDFFAGRGYTDAAALSRAGLAAFGGIAVGGIASVVAGVWADRLGRERVAGAAMAVSGACALTIGWLMAAPIWIVIALSLIWGFAIVADSAQFSALVTEVAPGHAVGTALTLQTSLGFLLSAATIWLMLEIQARAGWGPAFAMLAIGPIFGIWQILSLRNVRAGRSPHGS